jgi:uncharacterized membrane protein YfhO
VFSEVYYPDGWTAWIDGKDGAKSPEGGKEISLSRADWVLRCALLPAGEHDLVMRFEPKSYIVGRNISEASSIAILLLVLLSVTGIAVPMKRHRE